jgi:hypothetical protein
VVPVSSKQEFPALASWKENSTGIASKVWIAAWITSGPMPSPGITVILCMMNPLNV